MPRRLTRDMKNAMLGGVASGVADSFGVDPVLIRIGFILLTLVHGFGLLAYLVCWVVMPRRTEEAGVAGPGETTPADRVVGEVRQAGEKVVDELRRLPRKSTQGQMIAGIMLIFVGSLLLLDQFVDLSWPHWARLASLWPAILIAIGIAMLLGSGRGDRT